MTGPRQIVHSANTRTTAGVARQLVNYLQVIDRQ